MNSVAKQSMYFSAYPLRALEQAAAASIESNASPYLRALLTSKTKTLSRIRISPMSDPYRDQPKKTTPPLRIESPANEIKPEGRDWFNHYE